MSPQRIQLQRTKGWRKPAGAVVVARPSKWGNPFTLTGAREAGYEGADTELRRMCVGMYRRWLRDPVSEYWNGRKQAWRIMDDLAELAGKDLACWCPLEAADGGRGPCHADVLLVLANPEVSFPWAK